MGDNGKLIHLPDRSKGLRDFLPGQPLEQILGRKPTAFELNLLEQNSQLRNMMATMRTVKIFEKEEVDAQGNYKCSNILIQAGESLTARLVKVAEKTKSPIEQVVAFLLKQGIEIMEKTPEPEKKEEPPVVN